MITPQQRIAQLEDERQALYALGNGLDVDTEKRRARLQDIAARLAPAWEQERVRRAAKYAPADAAWGQRR